MIALVVPCGPQRTDHWDEQDAMSRTCINGTAKVGICRRHRFSLATLNRLKAKYGDVHVSKSQRPRAVEDENGTLKRLLPIAIRWRSEGDAVEAPIRSSHGCAIVSSNMAKPDIRKAMNKIAASRRQFGYLRDGLSLEHGAK